MARLSNGDKFPRIETPAVGGGFLTLPDDLAGHFGVVLLNRGSWCPYCNAQLAAFQRARKTFDELDIRVASISVDDEATSQALVDKHRLEFSVGHSADVDEIGAALDASTSAEPGPHGVRHFQSTGFVLAPDSTVITSVYSSGAIGRLVADDVAGLVRHIRDAS
jgi:peroxiredoxin